MSDSSFRDNDRKDPNSVPSYGSNRANSPAPAKDALFGGDSHNTATKVSDIPLTDEELNILLDELVPKSNFPISEPVSPATEIQALREALRSRGLKGMAALQCICVTVARVTTATGSAIGIAEKDRIICRASWGNAPDLGAEVNQNSGLSGACVRTAAVAYCRDSESDSRVNADACRRLQTRSLVIVPVLLNGRVDGLVEVFAPLPDAFSSDQIEFLKSVADLILELTSGNTQPYKAPVIFSPPPPPPAKAAEPPKASPQVKIPPPPPEKPVASPTSAVLSSAAAAAPAMKAASKPAVDSPPRLEALPEIVTQLYGQGADGTENTSGMFGSLEKNEEGSNNTKLIGAGIAAAMILAAGIGWMMMKPSPKTPAAAPAATQTSAAVTTPAPAATTQPAASSTPSPATQSNNKPSTSAPAPAAKENTEKKPAAPATETGSKKRDNSETIIEDRTTPVRFLRPSTAPAAAPAQTATIAPPLTIGGVSQSPIAALNLPSSKATNATLAPVTRASLQSGGKIIRRVDPVYPAVARAAHIEGSVVLSVKVSMEGNVQEIKTISGVPVLVKAAEEAVRKWQYEPYKLNGVPQVVDTTVTIRFAVPRN